MSYNDIATMAKDGDLRERIAACAAEEGVREPHPTQWADRNQWALAASPGWADAYGYALNTNTERPGKSESVITDTMILAAVQILLGAEG